MATKTSVPRILIVDDHPNTATMLARALGQFPTPVEILTARSGQEALDIVEQSAVDIMITDFMMPGMNGLELIEKLKDGREPTHTILITAYDSAGLAATARRLKVNDYLVKPFPPEKIRVIVTRVLESMAPPKPLFSATVVPAHFKILIADDRPDNVQLLATRLSAEGYRFITAGDGEETLQQVRQENPDLVLLDVDMPKKNGFEVLTEMRADPAIAHVPVIVLTAARTAPRDIIEGLGLGADDYVTKPFDWRELVARVRAKLRVKQAEDALRRRNRELSLLPEISQDLTARTDIDELAEVTLRRSVEALQADNGHLVVFQRDGTYLHKLHIPLDFAPLTWEAVQKCLVEEGVVAHIAATAQGVLIGQTENDARWVKLPNNTTQSAVSVPLLSRRGVIGVLTLMHSTRGYFNQDHLSLLQAIAGQAAIAIENAQLYAAEHMRANELVALNTLTREIGLFTHSAELFDCVPQLVHDVLGYPIVSLWLTAGGTPVFRCAAGMDNHLQSPDLALAVQDTAASGVPVHIGDAVEDAGDRLAPLLRSALAVPLFWETQVGGVLAVHSPRPHVFQESDRVVLETVAAQIAGALERIRLFESVEQEEQLLAAVLRSAADAVLVLDPQGRVRLINSAAQSLFAEAAVQPGRLLPTDAHYADLLPLLDEARTAKKAVQGEVTWSNKRTFDVQVKATEDYGYIVVLHDVTYFKDLDRVKNEFIATASHDLKNPITSILGYSDLLAKAGPLNECQADFVGRMQQAAKQMHELVLNLLELARMDMGLELKPEPCDVGEILTGVVEEFRPQASAKQQTLTLQPLAAQLIVNSDPLRLRQVVRNLIGNAIKYTPTGGWITVSAEPHEGVALIKVQDTGIGIPAADLPYLFNKFYRVKADDRQEQEIEGSGLGLAIVKSIVEQYGGWVNVDSELGRGSCFSVGLPLASQPTIASWGGDYN